MVSDNNELYGYKYKYNLPADLNGIYAIYNKSYIERDYKLVGYNLYSNVFPLDCQYTSSDLSTSYPPHFANCLSYWLSKELCVAMGSSSSQPLLIKLYEESLQQAKLVNGKDKPSPTYISDYYSSARY